MAAPWQAFPIAGKARANLIRMAASREPVIPFAEHRPLASALACLGLQAEMGGTLDRLGEAFGIPPSPGVAWQSETIEYKGELGLRLWKNDVEEFHPTEERLSFFLHPLSIDEDGKLSRLVFFPALIADAFRARGIELVIVRDWILHSGLVEDRAQAVDYTRGNVWEIGQNIAYLQAGLMRERRLAFFGTHDLADHLMGATREGLDRSRPLVDRIWETYGRVFAGEASPYALTLSYLIGLALDDLAQPQWYGSRHHEAFIDRLLARLENDDGPDFDLFLPTSFNDVVAAMRDKSEAFEARVTEALEKLDQEMSVRGRQSPSDDVVEEVRFA